MPPQLIITRPKASATRFAQDVQDAMGRHVDCIFSPAYDILFLPLKFDTAPEALVFTSANGVAAAARAGLRGQAWCVGNKTAEVAEAAGFVATSANGDVDDLYRVIRAARPVGPLVHVAGQHTRGDLAQRLTVDGINCSTVTAYDQPILSPTEQLVSMINGSDPLVIPLFSARAALILAGIDIQAPVHVVAMSQAIGDAATDLLADTVVVTKAPTYQEMVDETCRTMTQLQDRTG